LKVKRAGQKRGQDGLTPATIRFCESKGLLDTRHRTLKENSYHDYRPEATEWLRQIGQAKRAGFTLREIAEIL